MEVYFRQDVTSLSSAKSNLLFLYVAMEVIHGSNWFQVVRTIYSTCQSEKKGAGAIDSTGYFLIMLH